ncbi:MAG: thioredoxin family protein [Gammaproteobacteria bacterium]
MGHEQQSLVHPIQSTDFEELLAQQSILFVDFWAPWCAPCKQFKEVYANISAQYPNIYFGSVNIEQETALADLFELRSIPHLMVFKHGVAIYSESGAMPESTLKELVEQALVVDVDAVREED